MKNRIMILMILTFIYNIAAFTTEYPVVEHLSAEWQDAGLVDDIPVQHLDIPVTESEILNFNLVDILQDHNGNTISPSPTNIVRLLLPAGEFNLTTPIELQSYIILKGNHQFRRDEDRSQRTILNFNLGVNKNCINVGSSTEPMEKVGIEDLWIVRQDNSDSADTDTGNNIHFTNTSNSWVIGVESTTPVTSHIRMINSEHNYVAGCYFNNAHRHGDGGEGYGVFIEYDSHHILVENNIFRRLRHSMIVQNGAHHNVFGYNTVKKSKNTSIEDLIDESVPSWPSWLSTFLSYIITNIVPDDYTGDLLCHGESSQHYDGTYEGPYENLLSIMMAPMKDLMRIYLKAIFVIQFK